MSEKCKIGIGAPTYNSVKRLEMLLSSIELYGTEGYDVQTVILDDGSQDFEMRKGVEELALRFGVDFIHHEKNEGIPKSWNDLTDHFKNIDYMILFNDDIAVSQNWLRNFIYLMDNNPQIGNVGFSIVHVDPVTMLPDKRFTPPDENNIPGRVGSPNGCSFGFRRDLWGKIINPDNSRGFWENLVSFYEELSFSFEIAKMGFHSFQLPTPLLEHLGSRTFGENKELSTRQIGSYITKEEYLSKLKENKNLWIPFEQHEELALKQNLALRMDYARMMFSKHWGADDYINSPQVFVHSKYVDVLPKIEVKWLDKDGNERKQLI